VTGKGHFDQAVSLLAEIEEGQYPREVEEISAVGMAQVHAILALVEAQLAIATTGVPSSHADSIWLRWGETP
jgi:hypothetical protein